MLVPGAAPFDDPQADRLLRPVIRFYRSVHLRCNFGRDPWKSVSNTALADLAKELERSQQHPDRLPSRWCRYVDPEKIVLSPDFHRVTLKPSHSAPQETLQDAEEVY